MCWRDGKWGWGHEAIVFHSRHFAGGCGVHLQPLHGGGAFGAWANGLPAGWVEQAVCDPYIDYGCVANNRMLTAAKAAAAASGYCDPYVNYKCLDAYLGDSFFTRFYRYYELEWGKGVAPTDPHAPAGSRSDAAWPPTPESSPPMPFAEWPYGGTQNIAKTLPNSVNSPLMIALAIPNSAMP